MHGLAGLGIEGLRLAVHHEQASTFFAKVWVGCLARRMELVSARIGSVVYVSFFEDGVDLDRRSDILKAI